MPSARLKRRKTAMVNLGRNIGVLKALNFADLEQKKCKLHMPGTREWCFNAIMTWLDNESEDWLFWLLGSGGTGKSVTFAKMLERLGSRCVARHYCLHTNPGQNQPLRIIQSLTAQMCENIVGFKDALVLQEHLRSAVNGSLLKTGEIFETLVLAPLLSLSPRDEAVVLAIDALDELPGQDGSQNTMLSLIQNYMSQFPKWIKVFVTSREDVHIKKTLKRFSPAELCVDDERNKVDVVMYISKLVRKHVNPAWSIEMVENDVRKFFPGVNLPKGALNDLSGAFQESLKCYAVAHENTRHLPGFEKLLGIREIRPEHVCQKEADLGKLMKQAQRAQIEVCKILATAWEPSEPRKLICKKPKERYLMHPVPGQSASWFEEAFHPGPKSLKRARQKAENDFNGDASKLTDLCRCTLQFNSVETLLSAFEKEIPKRFGSYIRLKNKYKNPTPLGHRDLNINVELHGHILELQLNLEAHIKAQHASHKFYSEVRAKLPEIVGKDKWKAVFKYITKRLNESSTDIGVSVLSEKAGGLMVYAKVLEDYLDDEAKVGNYINFETLDNLPSGLDGMYLENFGRVFQDSWDRAKPPCR